MSNNLPARLGKDGRVHGETCLTAIGAIAGFAAQRALFNRLVEADDKAQMAEIRTIRTQDGAEYFVGEPINRALVPATPAEAKLRLWSLAASGAVAAGLDQADLPKLDDMFVHVAKTIGGEQEGLPSVPERHQPQAPVRTLLATVWPLAIMCFKGSFPGAEKEYGTASMKFWPVIAGYAANAFIRKMKPILDPRTGLVLVMEAAIYASKLNPAVAQAKPQN
ncbi:MAG: hypothetical protein HC850_01000 [Rhodomicrobium sp.]|nr:hypothetical protein [Rhodomicrobium sp.]